MGFEIVQVTPVLRPLLHSDLHFETRMEAISGTSLNCSLCFLFGSMSFSRDGCYLVYPAMPVLLRLAISQEVILEDIQEELIYFITALVRNLEVSLPTVNNNVAQYHFRFIIFFVVDVIKFQSTITSQENDAEISARVLNSLKECIKVCHIFTEIFSLPLYAVPPGCGVPYIIYKQY